MQRVSGRVFRDKDGAEFFQLQEDQEVLFCTLSELVQQFVLESDQLQILLGDKDLLSNQVKPEDFDESVVRDLWSIGNLEDARRVLMEGNLVSLQKSMVYARQSGQPRHFHTQGLLRQLIPYDKNDHPFGHPAVQHRFVVIESLPDGTLRVAPCLTTVDFVLRDTIKCTVVGHETEHLDIFLSKLLANMLMGHSSKGRANGISQSLLNEVATQHPGKYQVGDLDRYCALALSNYGKLIHRPEFLSGTTEMKEKVQQLGRYKFFCGACKKAGPTKKCAACERIHYCSKACQERDWKEHKQLCKS
jgi:hypothetical protein